MSKSKISNNYLPILEDFVKNGGMELLIKSGYDQGPFIPYVFENYEKAPVKLCIAASTHIIGHILKTLRMLLTRTR